MSVVGNPIMLGGDGGGTSKFTIYFSSYESYDEFYDFIETYLDTLFPENEVGICSCTFINNTSNTRAGIFARFYSDGGTGTRKDKYTYGGVWRVGYSGVNL